MTKDELKIKIAECFDGRGCSIDFDPLDHYGWLNIKCGPCVFPNDIERLRKFLYVSNITASIDYSVDPHLPFIEVSCSYIGVL